MTIEQLSAAAEITIFFVLPIYQYWKGNKIILSDIVIAAMAAGRLPLAFGLTMYVYYPSLINSIERSSFQFTIAGLVLFFVSIKTIIEKANKDS